MQTELDKKNNMYRSLKKEYQKSKRLISEYQLMLRAGASGMHKVFKFFKLSLSFSMTRLTSNAEYRLNSRYLSYHCSLSTYHFFLIFSFWLLVPILTDLQDLTTQYLEIMKNRCALSRRVCT